MEQMNIRVELLKLQQNASLLDRAEFAAKFTTIADEYSRLQLLQQTDVSGSLPLTDAEKLAVAWKTLQWVGFSKGVEFEDKDILEMLGGNDR